MSGDPSQRISVSQDLLRAELSELELRLTRIVNEAVRGVAQQSEVSDLGGRVTSLEVRVNALPASLSRDGIEKMIGEGLRSAEARGWTTRERWLGVGIAAMGLGSLVLTSIAALGS